jgi:CDP-diacylglycerol--glycerol-3-phosphate 3-phosphatidyltransferase
VQALPLWENLRKDWAKLPNLVPAARLAFSFAPAVLQMIRHDSTSYRVAAAISFALIAATDKLDGWLARKRDEVTELGKMLDPSVDKVLVGFTLLALCFASNGDLLVVAATVIILAREIWVAYMQHLTRKRYGRRIATSWNGKVKMTLQCVAICALCLPQSGAISLLAMAMMGAAVVATLWSGLEYVVAFRRMGESVQ